MNQLNITTALGAVLIAGMGYALYSTNQSASDKIAMLEGQLGSQMSAGEATMAAEAGALSALEAQTSERIAALETALSGSTDSVQALSSQLEALQAQVQAASSEGSMAMDDLGALDARLSQAIADVNAQLTSVSEMAAQSDEPQVMRLEMPQALAAGIDAHLMANPEIIEQALVALDMRRSEQAIAAVLESPLTPVIGNPDGDVTLVEFFDYNCGYCRQMGSDLRQMIQADPNLRVVLVELPILSEQSREAAEVSIAAFRADPEKYAKFHFDMILGGARIDGTLAEQTALLNGFDLAKVQEMSRDPLTQAAINSNYSVMQALEIRGTPAMYLNGQVYRGRTDRAQLERAIAQIRANQS